MITDILDKFDEIIRNTPATKPEMSNNDKDYIVINHYEIDFAERLLIIGNNKYNIPAFFNINNAIAGDYKTLDYIFTYLGLNTSNYLKREHKSINNSNDTLL